MRIILKPAGLLLLLGALVILTSMVLIKPQRSKIHEVPEGAPLDVFKSEKRREQGTSSIFDGQDAITEVDLAEAGTLDWVHWGLTGPQSINRKASGGNRISSYRLLNGDNGLKAEGKRGPTRGISWSGGAPTAKQALTYTGVHLSAKNGFEFHVPADTASHTLRVYAGGWRARGQFSAWFSDDDTAAGIKPKVAMQDTALANGYYTRVYTITIPPAPGKTLNVSWRLNGDPGDGNISLQAATLK